MKIRVLLADDHRLLREGLRMMLEARGDIEVVAESASGRETVQLVEKLQPDVVVLDISMPELNGIEAAQQIHQRFPNTHIIILSMHVSDEHVFRALQAGANAYLLKDSAGSELHEAIHAVCLNNRYFSQRITEMLVGDYLRLRDLSQVKSPLDSLSEREREVLQLVVEGRTSAEIAETLSLSVKTIDSYRSRLMGKLGVNDLPELVRFAIRHGVIHLN